MRHRLVAKQRIMELRGRRHQKASLYPSTKDFLHHHLATVSVEKDQL